MKIRIISDLHLEHQGDGMVDFDLPVVENENETVLLIAGDLGIASYPDSYIPFLKRMERRFKKILWIAGNHEFYHGSLLASRSVIKIELKKHKLTTEILDRETRLIGDTLFVCATLWTDMDRENPNTMYRVQEHMNDYNYIKTGTDDDEYTRLLWAKDTIEEFKKSKSFIFESIEEAKRKGAKIVVMTHHAPSHLSVSDEYKGHFANGGFVSELSNEIFDMDCEMLWIHGHVHNCLDYEIGKCRVICNPHGYPSEMTEFNPTLTINNG